MQLYYITDRLQFPGDEASRRRSLLDKISEAAGCGIEYIQLREKDLPARDLEILARQALARIRAENSRTALLINSRADVAIAVGASGVHLRSDDISPGEVGEVYKKCGAGLCGADIPVRGTRASPMIAVSCHKVAEVAQATVSDATFAVFGPVFGKSNTPPAGLAALREACRHEIPVLALGGITAENADSCLQAGAAGIAAIRLFQDNKISEIVRKQR